MPQVLLIPPHTFHSLILFVIFVSPFFSLIGAELSFYPRDLALALVGIAFCPHTLNQSADNFSTSTWLEVVCSRNEWETFAHVCLGNLEYVRVLIRLACSEQILLPLRALLSPYVPHFQVLSVIAEEVTHHLLELTAQSFVFTIRPYQLTRQFQFRLLPLLTAFLLTPLTLRGLYWPGHRILLLLVTVSMMSNQASVRCIMRATALNGAVHLDTGLLV